MRRRKSHALKKRYGRFSLSFKRYASLAARDRALAKARRHGVKVYAWPKSKGA